MIIDDAELPIEPLKLSGPAVEIDLIDRLRETGCKITDEAAAAIASLREERDELTLEIAKVKHGDGWRAFEEAKAELGRIINDDYAARSMWPRLHRVKTWWDDMKARKDNAEAQLNRADLAAASLRERVMVLEGALRIADDDIRHHLRNGEVSSALIRQHAVAAIRAALANEQLSGGARP